MDAGPQIINRRAIEALRNGAPNRDAVKVLGCDQKEIEERFRQQLERTGRSIKDGLKNEGILVSGDFGDGKSHLLEYLKHIALKENFVCSKVVVSKETPLYHPVKLYRAAAEAAVADGKRGNAITEVATALNFGSQHYADFYQWANKASDLDSRFPATLFLFEHMKSDQEASDRIRRFWCGEKLDSSEIRRYLRACGEAVTFKIEKISAEDLGLQRFKFAARLIVAAGYAGWVLLIDEVDMLGHYPLLKRAKAYAELARWMGKLEGAGFSGLTSILTITTDFQGDVLVKMDDLSKVPGKLKSRGTESDHLLASQAERGMQVIEKEAMHLEPPGSLDQTYSKVRDIYKTAYKEWEPPLSLSPGETSWSMRTYIKSWITEWDLKRLDKEYTPDIEVTSLSPIYNEDPDLQKETEEGSDT